LNSNMKKLEGYSSRIKRLSELVAELESGNLTVEELSEMELITRELHERSIILRYNAFKDQVMPEAGTEEDDGAFIDENGGVEVEVIIEEIEEIETEDSDAENVVEEEPMIDFSIFDDAPEPEADPEPIAEIELEPEVPTPEPVVVVEPEVAPEPVKEEHVEVTAEPVAVEPSSNSAQSFLDKLKIEDNSVASRFTNSKLDSLIGAFGLNQRLRYINDLFNGSSELFSDAIKALDSQPSLDQANLKAGTLAAENEWDPEEEIVIEFMSYLNRRYA
jgi:hypothetical protein